MNFKLFGLLLSIILLFSNTAFCNTKDNKNNSKTTYNVTRLTPKQKEIRKQMFNSAVKNGNNRAKMYNIYY